MLLIATPRNYCEYSFDIEHSAVLDLNNATSSSAFNSRLIQIPLSRAKTVVQSWASFSLSMASFTPHKVRGRSLLEIQFSDICNLVRKSQRPNVANDTRQAMDRTSFATPWYLFRYLGIIFSIRSAVTQLLSLLITPWGRVGWLVGRSRV